DVDTNVDENHFSDSCYADIAQGLQLSDMNRAVPHIQRGELVRGDATDTIPRYVKDNPHLVVAMLYLDFDIYEPTKVALETILPLMPKGGIVAFDELAVRHWPGETRALKEFVDLNNLRIRRFPFEAYASYAVIGE
ncbi:MAG: dTDP-6-deoxy-L-hexose 3-O-methyltransferase, partial [Roseibium sp.]